VNQRKDRRELVKKVYEANPIHKRLVWIRGRLGLESSEVANGSGIPMTTYLDRENGRRTCYYEEILILAIYFQQKWKAKYGYSKMYPYFNDDQIEEITPMWLFFGRDSSLESAKKMLESIKEDFNSIELELIERNRDLENQIEMFKGGK
jgi:hypothetical protein